MTSPAEVAADAALQGGAGPPLSTPAGMLSRAKPELAACAKQCGGPLWVELATTAGEPRFTAVSVVCDGSGDAACARV